MALARLRNQSFRHLRLALHSTTTLPLRFHPTPFLPNTTTNPRFYSKSAGEEANSRETILRLLSTIASRREINQYLNLFSSVSAPQFAVIKVGGAIITQ